MKYYKTRLWYECTLIVEEFGDVYVVNAKPSDLIQAYENCGIDYTLIAAQRFFIVLFSGQKLNVIALIILMNL